MQASARASVLRVAWTHAARVRLPAPDVDSDLHVGSDDDATNQDPNDDAVADATDEHPANTANIANTSPTPSRTPPTPGSLSFSRTDVTTDAATDVVTYTTD